jgi:hypothetical protein
MNLKEEYTDPSKPGSFSGKSTFIKELKKRNKKIDKKKVSEWLTSEDSYTLHKPIRKKYKRNKIIVSGIDDTWQADLNDMTKISEYNDGFKFILTVIDVFSKYAWAIPLKNKSSKSVVDAFKKILEDGRKPKRLQTDAGNEFLNKDLKNLLKDVKMYIVNSEVKASVVERFNRTLKEKMWRFFTFKRSYRYVDVLEKLDSYNNTYHRTIKTYPSNVNKKNEDKIWSNIYGYNKKDGDQKSVIKFKFNVGDKVRISKTKNIFEKGYTANWTREIFIIEKTLPRVPPAYIIKDLKNEIIHGIFYEEILQKVQHNDDDLYYIENILQEKTIRGKKQYLVKWLGYPDKFNSWEPIKNFVDFHNELDINTDKNQEKNKQIEFSI